MDTKQVVVTQDEQEPIPAEIIAASIVKIADGFERIKKSGLTQRAILLLISSASKVPVTHVRSVLEGIDQLKTLYIAKVVKK